MVCSRRTLGRKECTHTPEQGGGKKENGPGSVGVQATVQEAAKKTGGPVIRNLKVKGRRAGLDFVRGKGEAKGD